MRDLKVPLTAHLDIGEVGFGIGLDDAAEAAGVELILEFPEGVSV